MESWSVDQVCNWLRQRNLGELVPKFRGKHFCCLGGGGGGVWWCLVFLSVPFIVTAYLVLGACIFMQTSDFYRNLLG